MTLTVKGIYPISEPDHSNSKSNRIRTLCSNSFSKNLNPMIGCD